MNKKLLAGLFLTVSVFSACSGSAPARKETAGAVSDGVSFGVYDISSSGPSFLPDLSGADPLRQDPVRSNTPINTAGESQLQPASPHLNTPNTNGDISLRRVSQSDPVAIDRKIVRNAELSLESDEPEESQKKIAAIAESRGGFVVDSQQSSSDVRTGNRDIANMTVRVPSDKFTETVDDVRAIAGRVIVETVKGEDVTEEFIDIDARLKAKKALEQQFMEIMKQADTVDDALNVQGRLADVRSEIEKIEGRRRFLSSQASLSTIKVRLQTPAVFSANSAGFFYRLSQSFATGFDTALNFTLGLVTFVVSGLPLFIFIGVPGYLIVRSAMRKRNRPLSITEIAMDEIKST